MTSKNEKKIPSELNNYLYNYTTDVNLLEEENKVLKQTLEGMRRELARFKSPALLSCEVKDLDKEGVVIRLQNGNEFLVNKSEQCKNLKAGDTVLCEQKNLTVVKKFKSSKKKFNVENFVIIEKPKISWKEIGGLESQEQELKEVIELPLKKPKLFEKVGITPAKGVLLYGPPGTGKTLLAKAVAASTNSTFIEIVGSELVQKFIGEGAKFVKEIFQLAREKAPAVIFIDEIDAIAAKRIEVGTSGEREVQRTFMQLLAELDGFKHLGNIKVIGCTNRKDILDPAVTRPGRLDRLIEVPVPDREGIEAIFKIHTKKMKLAPKVNIEKLYSLMEDFSGAEIKSVCTEAGYFAIRENRTIIQERDLLQAIEKVKEEEEDIDYRRMFG